MLIPGAGFYLVSLTLGLGGSLRCTAGFLGCGFSSLRLFLLLLKRSLALVSLQPFFLRLKLLLAGFQFCGICGLAVTLLLFTQTFQLLSVSLRLQACCLISWTACFRASLGRSRAS